MVLIDPKFISIRDAATKLNVPRQYIVDNILDGRLSIYGYGTTGYTTNPDCGDNSVTYEPEYLEPDLLSNPRKWNEDPYSKKAIWATYPTVCHTGLYTDQELVFNCNLQRSTLLK